MAKIYRTIQGDTFDIVAYRLWREEHTCHRIMQVNPDHMDELIFPAGVELTIPDYTPAPKVADLPPWYAGEEN